jgi:hypothetical protein
MKKNFYVMLSLLVLTLLLVGCGSTELSKNEEAMVTSKQKVYIEASYPYYSNFDELANKADLIIEGKILKSSFQFVNVAQTPSDPNDPKLNPGGDISKSQAIPYTIYEVEIKKSYKGQGTEKEIIQVKQVGGEDAENTYVLNDDDNGASKLKMNGNYLMFLKTYENSPASLLNPIQGSYTVENGNIIQSQKNTIKIELKDLQKLAK